MADRHVMVTEATLPHGWMVQCVKPDCSRRIFVYQGGNREIIDQGDSHILHSWLSNPELSIGAALEVSDG